MTISQNADKYDGIKYVKAINLLKLYSLPTDGCSQVEMQRATKI